ncbi:puatative lactoylglutathione lyase [Microbacterium sp. TS-1]|nr:puatative lactoylglutathione lyase [Microbacterium sp. TS-1]
MLSEIWSQILSGCPSVTDSDVNRRSWLIGAPCVMERGGIGTETILPAAADIRLPRAEM